MTDRFQILQELNNRGELPEQYKQEFRSEVERRVLQKRAGTATESVEGLTLADLTGEQGAKRRKQVQESAGKQIGAFAMGQAEGRSFGASDELMAGLTTIGAKALDITGLDKLLLGGEYGKTSLETYGGALDKQRAAQKELRSEAPIAYLAGDIYGGVKDLSQRNIFKKGDTLGTTMAKSGAYGGLQAFGRSEGDVVNAIEDVAVYGPISAAAPAVIHAVRQGGMTVPAVKKMLFPYTEQGAKIRASERVKSLVPDAQKAIQRLEESTIAPLTPAEKINEPGLLALQNEVRKAGAIVDDAFAQRQQKSVDILRAEAQSMRESGSYEATRGYVQGRVDKLINKAENMAARAVEKAQRSIQSLGANITDSQASKMVRDNLEDAYRSARMEESKLYNKIPKVGLPQPATRAKYMDLINNTPKAQMDDIPSIAHQMFDPDAGRGLKSIDSIKELQGFRSKLLEQSRLARSAGEYNKARISDELADSLLDDIGAKVGELAGPPGKALREALDYSRQLHQKFTQGPVGQILGAQRTGADRVAPELTLQRAMGSGNVSGSVGYKAVRQASPTPETAQAAEQYLRNKFASKAVKPDGSLNTNAAKKFLDDNVDLLDDMPEFRSQIQNAIGDVEKSARYTARAEGLSKSLSSKQKSTAGAVLGANVDQEFKAVLNAQDPRTQAAKIMRIVGKDADAIAGVKASAVDYFLDRSMKTLKDRTVTYSGTKILDDLADRRTLQATREILGDEGVTRLKKIATELQALEVEKLPTVGGVMNDMPSKLISLFGGTAAARAGAQLGAGTSGASLRTANLAVKTFNDILGKLTNDKARQLIIEASQDDKLMKALLTDISTPAAQKRVARYISGWAITPAGKAIGFELEND